MKFGRSRQISLWITCRSLYLPCQAESFRKLAGHGANPDQPWFGATVSRPTAEASLFTTDRLIDVEAESFNAVVSTHTTATHAHARLWTSVLLVYRKPKL